MKYETQDYFLSAYLVASGCVMVSHHWNGSKLIFEFDQSEKLLKFVQTYYSLQGQINPQAFTAALKNLKNIMYQYKNNDDNEHMSNFRR